MKCLWLVLSVLAIVIALIVTGSSANGAQGENLDPEAAAELLLERYIKARRMSPFGYMGGLPFSVSQQKRNSELINSILGLPKVMNDAGRRK